MSPQDALSRIRAHDPQLHAFVRVFDPPLGAGDGPLLAVKDLIDIAGEPTGGGARTPLIERAESHAAVVERLLAAGYRIVGKTHTVELAYGGWGTNRAVGAPWNPWRRDRHHARAGRRAARRWPWPQGSATWRSGPTRADRCAFRRRRAGWWG
jgi:aspartyl-tRNA(Asn)/glutamyl-tRNA(Gln) amidotransferase subunit A